MPDFKYVCVTLKGEYLRGEYTAQDKNELAYALWQNQLFLIWWEDISEQTQQPGSYNTLNPNPIPRDEISALWQSLWRSGNPPLVPTNRDVPHEFRDTSEVSARVKYIALALAVLAGLLPWGDYFSNWKQSYNFHKMTQQMRAIADAGKKDFDTNKRFASQVMPGQLPEEFQGILKRWPTPPCPGWVYSWDNWTRVPGMDDTVRVTLRDANLYSVYYLCLSSSQNCSPTMMWGNGRAIEQANTSRLTCRENIDFLP